MIGTILDISVIICSYASERRHELVAAVESLRQQVALPREVIVVIDHNPSFRITGATFSRDATLRVFQRRPSHNSQAPISAWPLSVLMSYVPFRSACCVV